MSFLLCSGFCVMGVLVVTSSEGCVEIVERIE